MTGDIKDIVDSMYGDFDWYGKFTKADTQRFLKLVQELNEELGAEEKESNSTYSVVDIMQRMYRGV